MKAAEEMKREQKEVKLRMILQDYHRRNDYELQQAMNDILALDALPPAEGAEEILHKYVHTINSDGTSLVTFMGALKAMREFAAQQQPTAEGAEEIDDETIAYAAEYQCGTPFSERWIGFVKGAKWHRSLHAQKIADKMVSEMLREELIKYDRWMSGNYWGVKQIPTPEQSVDEYLKSRER